MHFVDTKNKTRLLYFLLLWFLNFSSNNDSNEWNEHALVNHKYHNYDKYKNEMSFFFAVCTATDCSSINCIFYNNNNPTKQVLGFSFRNRDNKNRYNLIS